MEDLHVLSREEYLALPDNERPHLYPGREPSNSTYTGTKNQPGCRCLECRSEHAKAVRKNRQVIRLEPESVTDSPVGPESAKGGLLRAADGPVEHPEVLATLRSPWP
jgi:hypothetical protein